MLTIDRVTARRFILGRQGLWPGRRWRGAVGTEQAMLTMEYLQLDPLHIMARSHDIALHSRVLDYSPGMWERPTYEERRFFDWGGWLAVRPMAELPHWRVVMRRERDENQRLRASAEKHEAAVEEMRALLAEQPTVTNRDFSASSRTRTNDYRGRKDSAVALYYLWRTGEVMTHHRVNFERVYALTERVAPAHLVYDREDAETDRFLVRKEIAFLGLGRLNASSDAYSRGALYTKKAALESLLDDGEVVEVKIEGWRGVHYALATDVAWLNELAAGRVPAAWTPLDTTTTDEAVFLAPLDPVSARGRAKVVFDFDYVWEVYKPVEKRQYGYYTLPVLRGDQLVARFDGKLDRETNTLGLLGLWLENDASASDEAFCEALARGFARYMAFLGAKKLDAASVSERRLRTRLSALRQ